MFCVIAGHRPRIAWTRGVCDKHDWSPWHASSRRLQQYLTINIAPRCLFEITTISTSNNGKMNFGIWYRVYNRFHHRYLSQYDFASLFIYLFYLFDRYWWVRSTCSSVILYYVLELYYLFFLSLVICCLIHATCFVTAIYFLLVFWS